MSPLLQNWLGGIAAIALTIALQFLVQLFLVRMSLRRRSTRRLLEAPFDFRVLRAQSRVVLFTVMTLFLGHLAQVGIWSALYVWLGEFHHPWDAAYFSLASFTTVGASELELSAGHRVLGAAEAGIGMLMFGWSTALLVALIGHTWDAKAHAAAIEAGHGGEGEPPPPPR
jgi:Ion channel